MKQEGSIALFQYWHGLRNGRPAPARSDIEPADIRKLLADTFILERDMRGEAVFRLAGTRLCAAHGRELKGFSFPSLWRARDQRLVAKLAQGTFQAGNVVVLEYQGVSEKMRTIPFEIVLLPLDGGRDAPRCLGIATSPEKPFWLGSDPIMTAEIESVRVVDPDREPVFLNNRPALAVPPLVPEDGAFSFEAQNSRRVRHLVVLDGGRKLAG